MSSWLEHSFVQRADEVIICLFEDMGDGRKGWSADTGAVISYPDSIENISDKLY